MRGCQTSSLILWIYVRSDSPKYVDQDEEEGDEHGHATGDVLGRDEERHPRHHDEQSRGQVVDGQVLQLVPVTVSWRSVYDGTVWRRNLTCLEKMKRMPAVLKLPQPATSMMPSPMDSASTEYSRTTLVFRAKISFVGSMCSSLLSYTEPRRKWHTCESSG